MYLAKNSVILSESDSVQTIGLDNPAHRWKRLTRCLGARMYMPPPPPPHQHLCSVWVLFTLWRGHTLGPHHHGPSAVAPLVRSWSSSTIVEWAIPLSPAAAPGWWSTSVATPALVPCSAPTGSSPALLPGAGLQGREETTHRGVTELMSRGETALVTIVSNENIGKANNTGGSSSYRP